MLHWFILYARSGKSKRVMLLFPWNGKYLRNKFSFQEAEYVLLMYPIYAKWKIKEWHSHFRGMEKISALHFISTRRKKLLPNTFYLVKILQIPRNFPLCENKRNCLNILSFAEIKKKFLNKFHFVDIIYINVKSCSSWKEDILFK